MGWRGDGFVVGFEILVQFWTTKKLYTASYTLLWWWWFRVYLKTQLAMRRARWLLNYKCVPPRRVVVLSPSELVSHTRTHFSIGKKLSQTWYPHDNISIILILKCYNGSKLYVILDWAKIIMFSKMTGLEYRKVYNFVSINRN